MQTSDIQQAGTPSWQTNVITRTQGAATSKREELAHLLSQKVPGYTSEDTSLVVFGSLARGEWTSRSDLDWIYLIDGQANSDHLRIAQQIARAFSEGAVIAPGPTGTFGNMAFSHDLIHQIGGANDTNENLTQRILLLLESTTIGRHIGAYERVLKGIINRYLEEEPTSLLTRDLRSYRVPRFLLNDIVRFWRTMAVDFASKQRDRGGQGWGLRNAKLRMSRKLIFASGLLVCFSCQLDSKLSSAISTDNDAIRLNLVNHIREHVKLTPLENLAKSMHAYGVREEISRSLFSSYSDFLQMIDDPTSRETLNKVRLADSGSNETFQKMRKISEQFQAALDEVFFKHPQIEPLTRKYGVF